jgi:hypothetical protein
MVVNDFETASTEDRCGVEHTELVAQEVHDDEHHDHQDGDPNRHFGKRTNAWNAPVEGKSFGVGEIRFAVPASLSLERADAATIRAGLRIKPIRH